MLPTSATPGKAIQAARIAKGFSVEGLASAAGVTPSCLYRIEAGGPRGPQMATLRKLAAALDTTPIELLGRAA